LNKIALVIDGGIFLGILMAAIDLSSSPGTSLLGANSTMLMALTITSVVLLAVLGTRGPGNGTPQALERARETPIEEMAGILDGASKGYTLNRKEIALNLRAAVNARIGDDASPLPHEDADAYLKNVLGSQTFEEFFSEDSWRATRVQGTHGYLTRLRLVVASLKQSLGF
jgi:hypothetical protein